MGDVPTVTSFASKDKVLFVTSINPGLLTGSVANIKEDIPEALAAEMVISLAPLSVNVTFVPSFNNTVSVTPVDGTKLIPAVVVLPFL